MPSFYNDTLLLHTFRLNFNQLQLAAVMTLNLDEAVLLGKIDGFDAQITVLSW